MLVHDLRPAATDKWCKGIVTKVLDPLTYEVCIDGYTRKAHIDHLLSFPATTDDANSSSECSSSTLAPPELERVNSKRPL